MNAMRLAIALVALAVSASARPLDLKDGPIHLMRFEFQVAPPAALKVQWREIDNYYNGSANILSAVIRMRRKELLLTMAYAETGDAMALVTYKGRYVCDVKASVDENACMTFSTWGCGSLGPALDYCIERNPIVLRPQ